RSTNPEVADLLLRARSIWLRPHTPEQLAGQVPLLERAVELDPNSATALAGLAEALLDSFYNQGEDPTAPDKFRRAEELLKRAELLRPDRGIVMWVRVYLLGRQDRCQEAIPAAQRTIEVYPGGGGSNQWLGICLMRMGRAAEAITQFQQAIRIHPRN